MTAEDLARAGEACHAFEEAWLDVIGLAETVVGSDFEEALLGFGTRDAN